MTRAKNPDIETVFDRLNYDAETGVITWRVDRRNACGLLVAKAGEVAGGIGSGGYRYVRMGGRSILAHRLAWILAHGACPVDFIDHINGVKDDNRLCNLRQATKAQNAANYKRPTTNTSGFKGVSWCQGAWQADIRVEGKTRHLGRYSSREDAHAAYMRAAREHRGEFASDGRR